MVKFAFSTFCLWKTILEPVLCTKRFLFRAEIFIFILTIFHLRSPNELPFFEPEKVTPLPSGTMRELTMILKELRVLTDKLKADEDDDAIENDWKFAAMVLDRLCLITFTGFTMLATAALLITAPHVIVT